MKKSLFFLLLVILCLICVFTVSCSDTPSESGVPQSTPNTEDNSEVTSDGTVTDTRDITIRSIYEIIEGVEHEKGVHVDNVEDSVIELDYRSVERMVSKDTGSSKTYYPRIKALADGSYMLIYQDGRWGPNIYYKLSSDHKTWSEPKLLFGSCDIDGDRKKFATADAVVMPDGEIIVVCTYLSEQYYTQKNTYNGMVLKRSKDNAQTWSDMEKIYGATNWEPDILLRSDGELQIYFTHTGPYIELYGYHDKRSSGCAMLRSTDNGKTWTPDVSKAPYEAWRMLQIPVGNYLGRPYFTGQMPVAVELHNGDMMVAVETQYLDASCYISLGYSKDNWKTPLGLTQKGPAELKEKLWGGVAPYLVQFDSGEVVLSYVTITDGLMKIRMGDETGRSFGEANSVYDGISTGLWSSIETLDDHILGIACDYQPKLSSDETMSFLSISKGILNHSFTASKTKEISVDGDNADWELGVEALFLGSNSQAQASLRVCEDEENVYFIVDRLDKYISSKDTVSIFVCTDGDSYYKIDIGARGVQSVNRFYQGKFTAVAAEKIACGVYVGGTVDSDSDTDAGYVVELALSKSEFGIGADSISLNLNMSNTDGGESFAKDEFAPAKSSDRSSWIKVLLQLQ